MQLCKNYVNLKHCLIQKTYVKVIKAAHRRSNFTKTFASQKIFAGIGLRKNLFWNAQNFRSGKFYLHFEKNLVNVTMRMAEAFYNIFMYLYNKNILKYGQIARNGTESLIPDTEGCSSRYVLVVLEKVQGAFQGYSFHIPTT